MNIATIDYMPDEIKMEGMTGIEAAELIQETDNSMAPIFLTTSEEHRADAFHCHAYDYLTKPVQKDRLFRTVDYLLRIKTEMDEQKLLFSSNRREYSLPYSKIKSIRTESNGSNYLEIMDISGNTYRARMTFSSVSRQLMEDSRFIQLQSCVLVNLEHIAMLKENCAVLVGGEQLPFSGRKAKEIRHLWQNFMFANIRDKSGRR